MATETLEARVEKLESRVKEVEKRFEARVSKAVSNKQGWRWFVGIDANNPHFEEAVHLGHEWRNADRPKDEEESA